MWTISKEFAFSASHNLTGLPRTHQCYRLHGHNYVVVVELSADTLAPEGWIFDYGDLAPFKTWLDRELDHHHLNDRLPLIGSPTAEHIAQYLAQIVVHECSVPDHVHVRVGVSETPKTWAWWSA